MFSRKMSLPEKCVVCDQTAPKTLEGFFFDGLCSDCEKLWDDEICRLSKEVPPETSIHNLFAMATIATKEKYQRIKSENK